MQIFGDFDKSDLPKDASDKTILYRLQYTFLNNLLRTILWLTFYLCLTYLLVKTLETPPDQLFATTSVLCVLFEKILDKLLSIGLLRPLPWVLFLLAAIAAFILGFFLRHSYRERNRLRRELETLRMGNRKNETPAPNSGNSCRSTTPVCMDK